jgi:hypothetical protein
MSSADTFPELLSGVGVEEGVDEVEEGGCGVGVE